MGTSAGSTSTTHTTDTFNALAGITEEGFGGTSLLAYSRTADGAVWLDADYAYQYDLFGRLVQVNARGDLQITEGQPQGTIGPWLKHWTYDALGRVIRVQSPMPAAEGMAPQSYTERYYYDGDRRIVRLASIVQLEAGGKPILIKDEAGNGYLYQLAMVQDREWVWDPDGGDALLAQIDLLDNDRLAYVLGSLSGDPAVLIDEVGTPLARYGFDPYGNVLELDTLAPHAALPIGHKGLFFDRLDQPTTATPLAAGAKGHYFNRARTYAPKLGRFLQPDPNATGLPVTSELRWMGEHPCTQIAKPNMSLVYGSSTSLFHSVRANPTRRDDPTGLEDEDLADYQFDVGATSVASMMRAQATMSRVALQGLQTVRYQMSTILVNYYSHMMSVAGGLYGGATGQSSSPFDAAAIPGMCAKSILSLGGSRGAQLLELNASNFSLNLGRFVGGSGARYSIWEAHHIIPQALQRWFAERGLENFIHHPVFGMWLTQGEHKLLHSAGYNEWWLSQIQVWERLGLEGDDLARAALNFVVDEAVPYTRQALGHK